MKVFSHVMIGTNDLDRAKSFYDALLGTLDIPPARVDRHRIFYRTKTGTFSVSKPIDGKPADLCQWRHARFCRQLAGAD